MLSDKFRDWVEPDTALLYLAQELNIVDMKSNDSWHDVKWVFQSNNIYNRKLWDMLMSLVEMKFLELGEDQSDLHNHFRWVANAKFVDEV